ncbi:hypothetical protein N234_10040 [Ralstonia pickettii DTP0602]|nr:hypothetical protein N234_10040 [Ralstonia pickettii DTP0602]
MPDIFISYRREDSSATSELLRIRLADLFPRDHVFLDVQDIPAGADWQRILSERLREYDVVLAVVGPAWLTILRQRAENANSDFVRWEVTEALRQNKRVIPILIDGVQLPPASELPADLTQFARLQTMPLMRDTRDRDIAAIAVAVEGDGLVNFLSRVKQKLRLLKASVGLTVAIGAAVLGLGWVSLFDLLGLDTRTASWTMLVGDVLFEPALSDDLLLVGIAPLPGETRRLATERRAAYARLIAMATEQKVKAIAFDITLEDASPADAALIGAVRAARERGTRVVFGFNALAPDGSPVTLPGLGDAGAALGLTCIGQKLDKVVLGTLAMQVGKRVYGSFALYAVHGAVSIEPIPASERWLQWSVGDAEKAVPFSVREVSDRPDKECPAEPVDAVMARFYFPMSHRERLRDPRRRVRAEALLANPPIPAGTWRGKVIVVGAEHSLDLLQTRLDPEGPERYGFEIQADAVNAIMTGAIVTPVGFLVQWMLSVVMIVAAIAYRLWRVGKSRRLDWLVLPAACLAYLAIMMLLYGKLRLLMDSLYHLAAFVATWWALAALERRWSHDRN